MSAVSQNIEGRPARTGLYWLCQTAGWILYSCYHFYVNSVGYIDSLSEALLYCLLLSASGILLTALYRLLVLRFGWQDLPLLKLLPRVLLAVTLMAMVLTWINLRIGNNAQCVSKAWLYNPMGR